MVVWVVKKILLYILYLLLVWGGFRYFYNFPAAVEELWIKPVIWLVPLFWWNASLKERIVFFEGKTVVSLLIGLAVGIFYWLVFKGFVPVSGVSLDILGVALVTAVTEELVFSGFLLGYLDKKTAYSKILILTLVGVLVFFSRLPILIFDFHLSVDKILIVGLAVFATSVISGFVRMSSKNVAGSILARLVQNIVTLI